MEGGREPFTVSLNYDRRELRCKFPPATKDDLDVAHRLVRIRAKVFFEGGAAVGPQGRRPQRPALRSGPGHREGDASMADGRWLFSAPPGPGVVDGRLRASRLWAHLKRAKKAAGVKRGTRL